tara:strand:+ start:10598 stop:10960 length:363 start_codon:yes stop_codon:yes gene_type:complete
MSLLDDFKVRFQNDSKLDLVAIENDWASLDPIWNCYYCFNYGQDSCTDEAIFNLIAHLWLAESSSKTSPIKPTQSKSVGSVSVTYNASDDASNNTLFYNTTIYGQRFLRLSMKNRGGYFV